MQLLTVHALEWKRDTIMLPDTKSPVADAADTANPATAPAVPVGGTEAAVRPPPDGVTFANGWWLAAIVAVLAAAAMSAVMARGKDLTTAHRAAAAGTALLVVAALAIVAQAILPWYQDRML